MLNTYNWRDLNPMMCPKLIHTNHAHARKHMHTQTQWFTRFENLPTSSGGAVYSLNIEKIYILHLSLSHWWSSGGKATTSLTLSASHYIFQHQNTQP